MLKQQINSCRLCPLCKELPDGVLPLAGQGKNDGVFLLVESPIVENMVLEDYNVTLSQKMLFKFIKDCEIKDYYITNAVKCYSERTYIKKQINACSSWIEKELENVKPRCIISFGALPLKSAAINIKENLKNIVYSTYTIFHTKLKPITGFINYSPNYLLNRGQKEYNEAVNKTKEFLKGIYEDK